jgi:hypothetical protein
VDAWRMEYNTVRPHQAPNMDTPAERLTPAWISSAPYSRLWLPPELTVAVSGPGPASAEPIDDELYEESLTVTAVQSVLARCPILKPFLWG